MRKASNTRNSRMYANMRESRIAIRPMVIARCGGEAAAEVTKRWGGSVVTKITGADGGGCSRGAWTAPPPLAYLGQDRSKPRTRLRGGRAELCHASTAPGAVGPILTAPGSARTAGPSSEH